MYESASDVRTSDPHARLRLASAGLPLEAAEGAVILLHGRRRNAESILDLAAPLAWPGVAHVAPEAAERTWYPRRFLAPREDNEPELSSALRALDRLFGRLAEKGIGPEQTVLVGFSQGACLAAEYVGRRPRRYGGLAVLIGGLFGPDGTTLDEYGGSLEGTPIFLCTSDPDPFVPVTRVHETGRVFRRMGGRVSMRVQEGAGHVITDEGIAGARALIRALELRASAPRPAASSAGATAPARP